MLVDLPEVPLIIHVYPLNAQAEIQSFPVALRKDVFPSGQELELRLSPAEMPTAAVHGVLRDATGIPMARERIWLNCAGLEDRDFNGWADEIGFFAFGCLAPGEYEVGIGGNRSERRSLGAFVLSPGSRLNLGVLVPQE